MDLFVVVDDFANTADSVDDRLYHFQFSRGMTLLNDSYQLFEPVTNPMQTRITSKCDMI